MLELSLLVVSVLFSCLALVVSLFSMRRTLELNAYRVQWRMMEESYRHAQALFENEYNRIDGDLDRTKDKLLMLEQNFRRFRSRVTMQEHRLNNEPVEPPTTGDVPLTEAEKDKLRQKLHGARFGTPRDIRED